MSVKELARRRNGWARHVKYRQVLMQNFMNEVINTFKEQRSEIDDLRKEVDKKVNQIKEIKNLGLK